MSVPFPYRLCGLLLLVLSPAATMHAAQDAQPSPTASDPQLPEIADEPKTIDPATLMPASLAVSTTVDFSDSSLREVLEWLQNEHNLVVLTEKSALSEIGVLPSEPISDRLDDAPIYLLLNRLRSLSLAWYFEDDIVHITSSEVAELRLTTLPYNIGDLLDAGYDLDDLGTVIESAVDAATWESVGGPGVLSFLGDVMLVRQTDERQREVQGLLAALRNHARQTFTLDPLQHLVLRRKLDENVSVDFLDTPLETAVTQLADDAQIDIRLDMQALRELRVREREPVTLKLTDRKLKTVLRAMVSDLDLTWILQDGVLWITSSEQAEVSLKTAVYDVRDLCRDWAESEALRGAVMSQAESASWDDVGGPGTIHFARPGTLVVSNQESVLMEVLDLLETYRTALRASKPRDRDAVDPQEVVTVYYRLHTNVAEGLVPLLPKLVQPESWKSETQPKAKGEAILVASPPDLFSDEGRLARASAADDPANAQTLVVSRAVLIIRQTRAAHDEIAEVIRRVESGDALEEPDGGGFGMGGGFGGGFYSIPPASTNRGDEEGRRSVRSYRNF